MTRVQAWKSSLCLKGYLILRIITRELISVRGIGRIPGVNERSLVVSKSGSMRYSSSYGSIKVEEDESRA